MVKNANVLTRAVAQAPGHLAAVTGAVALVAARTTAPRDIT
jgi:hypothetical protein